MGCRRRVEGSAARARGAAVRGGDLGVNTAGTAIVERWHTATAYDADRTWVTPPSGGPTQTVADAYGRVTSVSEGMPSLLWSLVSPHTTSYGYNLAGDLTTVTDPAGNVISYLYDKAGRRTEQTDPDAGHWTYGYDDVGNPFTVTDAAAHTITTDYDALNRPTSRHEGATNLASWTYDATGEKGLLDKSTRITSGGNWITDITGYDIRNRPTGTKLTVPAGIPGLSGDYTTHYGYDRADKPTSIEYPAVGGLTAETVTTTYHDTLGLPATMTGTDTYAGVAYYDNRARPSLFGLGLYSGNYTLGRTWTYNADQRLASVTNAVTGGTGGVEATRHDVTYDPVGNITARTTTLGTNHYRECFTYDAYQRLTRAVTTATSTDCSTNPANPTGDLPYEQDYTHSNDGNLTSVDNGTGPVTSTYPTTGSPIVRPHAATSVGTDTYAWDANGDLDTRTIAGVTTDFTFDHEHNLATATSPAGTSEFVYDAGGQRLYQKTPQGSTLYLDGQEVNATPGATPTVTTTRLYTFASQLVATRTPAGGTDYMVTDHQGSVEAKIDATGTTVTALRAYKPYGQPRTTDTFTTQRGWIGQIADPTTNLNYLNARYYDPNLNRFISPDPLYSPSQPKSLNPYTYAWGNPITGTTRAASGTLSTTATTPTPASPATIHPSTTTTTAADSPAATHVAVVSTTTEEAAATATTPCCNHMRTCAASRLPQRTNPRSSSTYRQTDGKSSTSPRQLLTYLAYT